MIKNIIFSVLASTLFFAVEAATLTDRISGSIFGGLIGDALGKPTEFIKTPNEIFNQFPGGIKSFDDLKKFNLCWHNKKNDALFAPYTDDTAMVRITLKVLIEARKNSLDLSTTMEKLAFAYADDLNSPTGWAMPERAPGNACLKSIKKLQAIFKSGKPKQQDWWQAGDKNAAGCGAVMRAHAFGVIFADNPEKAAIWAAEHSKITHGHVISQAACAAMAVGTAYAIQGKSTEFIIQQMIAWAKKYDPVEERFNEYTKKTEKSCWAKMEDALALGQSVNQSAVQLADNDLLFVANKIELNKLFKRSEKCKIFYAYEGWAADDAISAALYIFAISPDNVNNALVLGVHTPGDSDSIASMAGALVGARVGLKKLALDHNIALYEGYLTLENYALQAASLIDGKKHHTAPHSNCYWIQPGRLLAGEYPITKNDVHQKKLDLYLDAGITSFIDLTEVNELTPYKDMLYKKAQARGIKANYHRVPIKDMDIPSVQTMNKIIDIIKSELKSGRNVYVHCWGGIGRTGTAVGCYLVSQGMTGKQALNNLAMLWKQVEKSKVHPFSPQTGAQRDFVLNYIYN